MLNTTKIQTILTSDPKKAAKFIKSGGLAAFPTETVYGLGVDVFNRAAIEKVFIAKGRPGDNPLIVHVANRDDIGLIAVEIPPSAQKFIEKFYPGPLTVVLRKRSEISDLVTAGLDTVGVRMPLNRLAQEFLRGCGTPVAAPSANLSGRPSPTTWQAVYEDLNGRIDCILQGEATDIGLESTVVDCAGITPVVLRQGAVSLEQLQEVVPETQSYVPDSSEISRSPGMKHRHYSPSAKVVLVNDAKDVLAAEDSAFIGLSKPENARAFRLVKICADAAGYAHELYEFFRECDRRGLKTIYCELPDNAGLGVALLDRLRRAAE